MVQTPTQRIANQKYAKREERKKGKPESAYRKKNAAAEKPPVSWGWVYLFGFLIAGGIVLQLISMFFGPKQ